MSCSTVFKSANIGSREKEREREIEREREREEGERGRERERERRRAGAEHQPVRSSGLSAAVRGSKTAHFHELAFACCRPCR